MSTVLATPAPTPPSSATSSSTAPRDADAGDLFAQAIGAELSREAEGRGRTENGTAGTASKAADERSAEPKGPVERMKALLEKVEKAVEEGGVEGVDLEALAQLLQGQGTPTAEQLQPFITALTAQGGSTALALSTELSALLPTPITPTLSPVVSVDGAAGTAPAQPAVVSAAESVEAPAPAEATAPIDPAEQVFSTIATTQVAVAAETIVNREAPPTSLKDFVKPEPAAAVAPAVPGASTDPAGDTSSVPELAEGLSAAASTSGPALTSTDPTPVTATDTPDTPAAAVTTTPLATVVPLLAPTHSSATASSTHPTQTPTTAVVQQIFPEVVRVAGTPGTHRLSITLNPAELGEVRVTVVVRGDMVRVDLHSEHARQALVNGSAELHRMLDGLSRNDVQVTVRNSNGEQYFQDNRQNGQPQRESNQDTPQRDQGAEQLWQDTASELLDEGN